MEKTENPIQADGIDQSLMLFNILFKLLFCKVCDVLWQSQTRATVGHIVVERVRVGGQHVTNGAPGSIVPCTRVSNVVMIVRRGKVWYGWMYHLRISIIACVTACDYIITLFRAVLPTALRNNVDYRAPTWLTETRKLQRFPI